MRILGHNDLMRVNSLFLDEFWQFDLFFHETLDCQMKYDNKQLNHIKDITTPLYFLSQDDSWNGSHHPYSNTLCTTDNHHYAHMNNTHQITLAHMHHTYPKKDQEPCEK